MDCKNKLTVEPTEGIKAYRNTWMLNSAYLCHELTIPFVKFTSIASFSQILSYSSSSNSAQLSVLLISSTYRKDDRQLLGWKTLRTFKNLQLNPKPRHRTTKLFCRVGICYSLFDYYYQYQDE